MRSYSILVAKALTCLIVGSCFSSCTTTPEDSSFTTAEGIITNRYTNLPVAAAPVTVGRRTVGFGYKQYDSLTTVYSDVNGHYAVSFNSSKHNNGLTNEQYVVHILYSQELFDLTNQPYAYPWNGTVTEKGKANKINLEVTSYKKVTIQVPAGKAGRSSIYLDFASTDQGNWFGNIILADTNRANQFIAFSRTIKVLPNRTYRFYRQLSGSGNPLADSQERRVFYNDTTTISFR